MRNISIRHVLWFRGLFLAIAAVCGAAILCPAAVSAAESPVVSINGGKGGSYTSLPVATTYQVYRNDPCRETNLANLSRIGVATDKLVALQDGSGQTEWEYSAPYYVGADGRRHAFPDSKTYYSWYQDLNQAEKIAPEKLASIPLGTNVHYRSGSRLIKFRTSNKVYAVSVGGELRWIKTESLAKELYGQGWKSKIDEIDVAYFANYAIGKDIVAASDFEDSNYGTAANRISLDLGI